MGSVSVPAITLYTAHVCPWAHRMQIALRELNLPFKTEIIDISVPRTKEYLAINPRGLVPALSYNGTILTESGVISQFLTDAHPSHLVKTSSEEGGAWERAKIAFFVATYETKVNSLAYPAISAEGEEKKTKAKAIVDAVVKELEPLLADAKPFFGGSSKLTLAEVNTGSFILRLLAFPKNDSLLPSTVLSDLETRAPSFWKWANAVVKEKSVNAIWDEKTVIELALRRQEKARAAAK